MHCSSSIRPQEGARGQCQFDYELLLKHYLLTQYSNIADIPEPHLINREPDKIHFIEKVPFLFCCVDNIAYGYDL